jgi:hypothetical protein
MARPRAPEAACPGCGTVPGRVHRRYCRRLAGAAIGGRPVAIVLAVRRFFCPAPGCGRGTFAEQAAGSWHPQAGSCPSVAVMSARPFQIVCEIEPPVRPDLTHARHQIGVLTAVSGTFLIPDNHIGRATVSSIAVAHEVQAMGGRSIACINSRDRNLLGFRRDLLTAAAYGVGQFLFVYGDKPSSGGRTSDLTVRSMIEEARTATAADPAFAGVRFSITFERVTKQDRTYQGCGLRSTSSTVPGDVARRAQAGRPVALQGLR